MNTVLSSYGQLSGCPEILKKSCKFFCRGLDIRVPKSWKLNRLLYCIILRFIEINYGIVLPLFTIICYN